MLQENNETVWMIPGGGASKCYEKILREVLFVRLETIGKFHSHFREDSKSAVRDPSKNRTDVHSKFDLVN